MTDAGRSVRLSICIPTYNRARFLRECLASVLDSARGFEDQVEVLVSDNASPDDTAETVAALQREYPALRYHRNETNTGDRNFAIAAGLASGSHVWLFGDDDKMTPQAVPAVLRQVEAGYDLIIANYSVWSQDLSAARRLRHLPGRTDRVFDDPDELLACFGVHLAYISAVVIKKPLLYQPSYGAFRESAEYGLSFLHSAYASMFPTCHAIYLSTPLFHNRSGNSMPDPALWERVFLTGSAHVFGALWELGYSPEAVAAAERGLLRGFVLPTILGRVRDGQGARGMLRPLLPRYGRSAFFWLACAPAMFAPGFLLKGATTLARWIRRARQQAQSRWETRG
jgi:hypothetical protein